MLLGLQLSFVDPVPCLSLVHSALVHSAHALVHLDLGLKLELFSYANVEFGSPLHHIWNLFWLKGSYIKHPSFHNFPISSIIASCCANFSALVIVAVDEEG